MLLSRFVFGDEIVLDHRDTRFNSGHPDIERLQRRSFRVFRDNGKTRKAWSQVAKRKSNNPGYLIQCMSCCIKATQFPKVLPTIGACSDNLPNTPNTPNTPKSPDVRNESKFPEHISAQYNQRSMSVYQSFQIRASSLTFPLCAPNHQGGTSWSNIN